MKTIDEISLSTTVFGPEKETDDLLRYPCHVTDIFV